MIDGVLTKRERKQTLSNCKMLALGTMDELNQFDAMVRLSESADYFDQRASVAVAALRKLFHYKYLPAVEPDVWRDEVTAEFCAESGLSHEDFSRLRIGEPE